MPSSRANNERGDLWLQFPVTSSFRRESEVSRSALKLLLKCSRYAVIFAFSSNTATRTDGAIPVPVIANEGT